VKGIKFEKVPFEQFYNDLKRCFPDTEFNSEEVKVVYDSIELPKRSTVGSAGYDFHTPIGFELSGSASISFPTGIRCKMPDDVVLMLYPRSGLGTKYSMRLANTTGVIDSSYYGADNYGHIMATIEIPKGNMKICTGDRFMQGVFVNYLTTEDDEVTEKRTGGFGSTGA